MNYYVRKMQAKAEFQKSDSFKIFCSAIRITTNPHQGEVQLNLSAEEDRSIHTPLLPDENRKVNATVNMQLGVEIEPLHRAKRDVE